MPKTIGRGLLLGLVAALVVYFAAIIAHPEIECRPGRNIFDLRYAEFLGERSYGLFGFRLQPSIAQGFRRAAQEVRAASRGHPSIRRI